MKRICGKRLLSLLAVFALLLWGLTGMAEEKGMTGVFDFENRTVLLNSGYTALIPEIDTCDAMLILAPVHWDQFPAQLKAFLDRTYSFMDFSQPDFSMAGRMDKKLDGYFFAGFGPVDVYTQMVETNLKSFATARFRDYKAHVAGDANVPGSIMEKPDDLKAADEMVEWLLA